MRLCTPSLDTDAQVSRIAGHDFGPPLVPEFDPARILPQRGRKYNPFVQYPDDLTRSDYLARLRNDATPLVKALLPEAN